MRGGASPAYSAVPKSRELGYMVEYYRASLALVLGLLYTFGGGRGNVQNEADFFFGITSLIGGGSVNSGASPV